MSAYLDPPRIGEIVVTPRGKLAMVMGYDGEGRCDLRYLSEDGSDEGQVVLFPCYLRKRREG